MSALGLENLYMIRQRWVCMKFFEIEYPFLEYIIEYAFLGYFIQVIVLMRGLTIFSYDRALINSRWRSNFFWVNGYVHAIIEKKKIQIK